jgi:hypothetical protein
METIVGVLIGIAATVLVSHYYFRRSTRKSLGVYELLDSLIFAGIDPLVRSQLHFSFRSKEVEELHQLMFVIANDGERPIATVIEPLTLVIPPGVELLDASILHREPDTLTAKIGIIEANDIGQKAKSVSFEFPLLNRGDFFVIKLLLSGRLPSEDLSFRLLAEDLPRTIRMKPVPHHVLHDQPNRIQWGAVVAGGVILLVPTWLVYSLYLLRSSRPEIFPYPWASFVISIQSIGLLVPAAILFGFFSFLGLMFVVSAGFGGEFPPPRGPHFSLPRELRAGALAYHLGRAFPVRRSRETVSNSRENERVEKAV